ncbi:MULTISPECIES: ATP synthase subunit I [Pseudomonas]|uniref:ATP synthase subunit I n=1 Tax=Pseudomonas TaxID=286 RepID=UPI000CD5098B|nr:MULTISPECIES: ATP synthase subunit I [Pseudomonas]RBH52664.1 ATP synthase subunit I [Pseudomonas sp. MWU13-2860]
MNELSLLAPLLAGVVLGVVFFGGLWWTVRRAMASPWVGLWFFASLLVRTTIVLVGLYLACGDTWQRWLAALSGFVVARLLIMRLSRPAVVNLEGDHAP